LRRILYEGVSPNGDAGLVYKLAFTSTVTFVAGLTIFSRLKHKFFDYL
jgi:ABC-type polysaccharide/polyol phosphate export permease